MDACAQSDHVSESDASLASFVKVRALRTYDPGSAWVPNAHLADRPQNLIIRAAEIGINIDSHYLREEAKRMTELLTKYQVASLNELLINEASKEFQLGKFNMYVYSNFDDQTTAILCGLRVFQADWLVNVIWEKCAPKLWWLTNTPTGKRYNGLPHPKLAKALSLIRKIFGQLVDHVEKIQSDCVT